MKRLFVQMAAYNRWANRRLYAAVADLAPDEFTRDLGAFFGSVRGTLNHLIVADSIWMERFTGERFIEVKGLDFIPFEALDDLASARADMDAWIIDFVAGLDDAALEREFTYSTMTAGRFTNRQADMLQHLFNHQTHHRGQTHGLLSLLKRDPPPLDLLYYIREMAQDAGR
ncbi:DinB family protein [Zavarzinia compransoris]|uniref:DinB family protein n=1 Tax=Zavarzinia marina TaxID=2911065 RepID=UPI001F209FAB|nr:DinB family protein [Zavarzinia marina]MCF4164744.1 DinB family protein [Zavarzinia marina]